MMGSPSFTFSPAGASQAPGPPLATASAPGSSGPVDPADPTAVAAACFTRWQSFDARTDSGPDAGVERARDCLTPDFYAQLSGSGETSLGGADAGRAWQDLRAHGTRSSVSVLATTQLSGDTTGGRVVLLLNVRRQTASDGSDPVPPCGAAG